MTVKELIGKLQTCDPNDHITFYYLKNHHLTNCQFETLIWGDDMCWELTIQNTQEFMEEEN
jgi:hypothetical protein